MIVRLNVSYPATDGSMPESVEIEWTDPSDAALAGVAGLLSHLLAAAAVRSGGWEAETQRREALTSVVSEQPHCRRTVCGHARALHTSADDAGVFVGPGQGMCSVCRNADKCRSFVGA